MTNKLYSTLLYSTLLYSTLLYSTLLYSTLLYSTLLYSTLLYSTLLYSTLLCSALLYSRAVAEIKMDERIRCPTGRPSLRWKLRHCKKGHESLEYQEESVADWGKWKCLCKTSYPAGRER